MSEKRFKLAHSNYCMDILDSPGHGDPILLVTLSKCTTDHQGYRFVITPGTDNDTYWMGTADKRNVFAELDGGVFFESFSVVFLKQKVCKVFSVKHGNVSRMSEVPFLVPGDVVTVQCDEGYGFKKLGIYETIREVVCTENMTVPVCSKIRKSKKNSAGDDVSEEKKKKEEIYFGIGTVVALVVLLVACFLPKFAYKKMKKCLFCQNETSTD